MHYLSGVDRQAGFLSHDDTVDNLTLFAREVMPKLRDYRQPDAVAAE